MKKTFSIILSIIFLFLGCNKNEDNTKLEEKTEEIVEVKIKTAKKEAYPIWLDFSGKLEAYKSVEIKSRINGQLKEIFFKAGDSVKKGQLLYKIDDSEYEAILKQKVAEFNKNEASYKLVVSKVERYRPLVEEGLAAREKLDELISQEKELKAVLDASKSAITQAQLNIEDTKIKATIDGVIGQNLIDVGNLVNATSSILAKIVYTKKLYATFNPSANIVSLINQYKSEKKPKVKIKLEDNELIELNGNIDFVDSTTNETTGTVLMRAIIDNKDKILFPGSFVKIKLLVTDKVPIIVVHPSTLGQNQLGSFLYVVNKDNKIETRQVEIEYTNKEMAILGKGINEGDKIIVDDIVKLRDGLLVKPIEIDNQLKGK